MKSKPVVSQKSAADADFRAEEYVRMADELRRAAAQLRALPQGDIAMADRLGTFAQQIYQHSESGDVTISMSEDLAAALRPFLPITRPLKK